MNPRKFIYSECRIVRALIKSREPRRKNPDRRLKEDSSLFFLFCARILCQMNWKFQHNFGIECRICIALNGIETEDSRLFWYSVYTRLTIRYTTSFVLATTHHSLRISNNTLEKSTCDSSLIDFIVISAVCVYFISCVCLSN